MELIDLLLKIWKWYLWLPSAYHLCIWWPFYNIDLTDCHISLTVDLLRSNSLLMLPFKLDPPTTYLICIHLDQMLIRDLLISCWSKIICCWKGKSQEWKCIHISLFHYLIFFRISILTFLEFMYAGLIMTGK